MKYIYMSFKVSAACKTFISRYKDYHLIASKHSNYQRETLKVRENHFVFQTPFIKIPADAVVSYENNTVTVLRGSVQLHEFSEISSCKSLTTQRGF